MKLEMTSEIQKWADNVLKGQGYLIEDNFESVRAMPWSHVYRILTSKGYVYLKQTAPNFSREGRVLTYLLQQKFRSLPSVIAMNDSLNCFLMLDAGNTLRSVLKDSYQKEWPLKALKTYALLQHQSIEYVQKLKSLGLEDCCLSKLPKLYQYLLDKKNFLKVDGLESIEIQELENLYPKFVEICQKIAHYNIPETLEHGDFHDHNILIHQEKITISDWGDAVISHPFFSLASFLDSAGRNHNIVSDSEIYKKLI